MHVKVYIMIGNPLLFVQSDHYQKGMTVDDFTPPPIGTIVSADITSDNADGLRDFYQSVMGWQVNPMPMGDYDDYVMMTPDGSGWAAGVCHLRGVNANQPANQWVVCFRVADIDAAIAQTEANGGKVIGAVRDAGPGSRYAVIQDPSGAAVSLIEFAES